MLMLKLCNDVFIFALQKIFSYIMGYRMRSWSWGFPIFLLYHIFLVSNFIFHEPLLELLVAFIHDIELLGKVFIPLLIVKARSIIFILFLFLMSGLSCLELPLVFHQQPRNQLTHQGVELGSQDALLQVLRCDSGGLR